MPAARTGSASRSAAGSKLTGRAAPETRKVPLRRLSKSEASKTNKDSKELKKDDGPKESFERGLTHM